MNLTLSKVFTKTFASLDNKRAQSVSEALQRFQTDPQAHGLNFEKLGGTIYSSIRVSRGWRIILESTGRDSFTVVDVGSHDIYRRYT